MTVVRIWIQPAYTGIQGSNLPLNELEYYNGNYVSPAQLRSAINEMGGSDCLVVSHSTYMNEKQRWTPVACHFRRDCPLLKPTAAQAAFQHGTQNSPTISTSDTLSTTSGPVVKAAELMVGRLIDSRLTTVRTALEDMTRQCEAAEQRCQVLEQNLVALDDTWDGRMSRVVELTLAKLQVVVPSTGQAVLPPAHTHATPEHDETMGDGFQSVDHMTFASHQTGASTISDRLATIPAEAAQMRRDMVEEVSPSRGFTGDSDESGIDDQRCAEPEEPVKRKERGGRFHRRWRPTRCSFPSTSAPNRSAILISILERERYSGDYIGDNITPTDEPGSDIRICTVNINKSLQRKMEDELAGWIIANGIDIAVVSDPGI
ncbi:unnamed protein product [Phytophthora fragariaefolia]|uniref:Unnamed protein product n=1 Tax=Phytophthora fragariaefolia TaxID=1490495 RepID=A0A9W7D3U7_9STRA|nr:unnamed protein product [Phytophthora fragariaefolia]